MKNGREVVVFTKSHVACGVNSAFRCCIFDILCPFCRRNAERAFFMNKYFSKVKLSVKDLCILALITAITVILALFATIRIGNIVKIPLKFVSVFITGVFFGPLWAGISAAIGDILNSLLLPVGPYMPQITMVEFLCGFVFGLFMYNSHEDRRFYLTRMVLCVFCQFIIDMFLTPVFLVQAGYFPSYITAISIRFPASLIKSAIQTVVLAMGKNYLKIFTKHMRKNDEK